MTTGERIAQKRKELGLSQEALGEKMGVSRQSIYKWESDAALPEIEKLVKLSREFSVSMDWLLGQEDGDQQPRELTPEQLRMVEEIVGRYLAAQAKPEAEELDDEEAEQQVPPPKKRRWPYIVAALVVICAISSLFSQVNALRDEYRNLQSSIYDINFNVNKVNHQVSSVTDRVQEVLQRQNNLTAEQTVEVIDTDYRANTVTVSIRALPRTYVEGMTAEFLLNSKEETVTVPGTLGSDHAFTAELTGPLSDNISVSVVLLSGNQRETQLLDQFFYLYSESLPRVSADGRLWGSSGGKIFEYADVRIIEEDGTAQIASLRLGLFRDRKLLAWYEHLDEQPSTYQGDLGNTEFFRLDGEWTMEPGHEYCAAAVIVDEYGRESVSSDIPVIYDAESGHAHYVNEYEKSFDSEDWEY